MEYNCMISVLLLKWKAYFTANGHQIINIIMNCDLFHSIKNSISVMALKTVFRTLVIKYQKICEFDEFCQPFQNIYMVTTNAKLRRCQL